MESTAAHRTLNAGEMLNWYRIDGVIGRGGFGVIYRATDTNLDHTVAIKEYIPAGCATREGDTAVRPLTREHGELYRWGLERFIKEARNLVRFKHPNIVRVMSVFQQNNTAYMVMEFEAGIGLGHYLEREGTTGEASLKALIGPVCEGLAEVHRHGFIHRDIKPANILIRPDGSPVLLDFGSARDATLNNPDGLTALVTVGYAPLEQYDNSSGEQQGPWTDIYALGGVLYRAISGSDPIDSARRGSALLNGGRDPMMASATIGRGRYGASFLAAVDWAMEFRIADRPQTLADWMPALLGRSNVGPRPGRVPALGALSDFVPDAAGDATRLVQTDELIESTARTAHPVPHQPTTRRFARRRRAAARRPVLTASVLTLSASLLVFVWWSSLDDEPSADQTRSATASRADDRLVAERAQQAERLADLERREQAFAAREKAARDRAVADETMRQAEITTERAEVERLAARETAREREAVVAAEAARVKQQAALARRFSVALDAAEAAIDERRTSDADEAIDQARKTGFKGRRLDEVSQRLQRVLAEMRRPVSDAEFDRVVRRFDGLKRAIESKDQAVIDALTDGSEQNDLFRQLNDNFARLNMEITGIRVRNADKSVTANLRIQDMVRDNGDRAVPSSAFRDREMTSRLVDGEWSAIDW